MYQIKTKWRGKVSLLYVKPTFETFLVCLSVCTEGVVEIGFKEIEQKLMGLFWFLGKIFGLENIYQQHLLVRETRRRNICMPRNCDASSWSRCSQGSTSSSVSFHSQK